MTQQTQVSAKKFGTFLGVFLPSILTVLGLIMYLRFGWVVGNLGLGLTIVVVIVSNVITFITGLSASAIATNIKVGVGGVYYLVSRSLGIETGGAIGIAFYISRTLSITFYSFGLAESILIFWPEASWGLMPVWITPAFTATIILIITFLAGRSAELMLKFQVPMLVLVALSILALIIGVFSAELQAPEWGPTYRTEPGGFWLIFAVFFPGVTGFLAGIAMSGDLKKPGKSIPSGTISSVLVGTFIYLLIPILLSITAVVTVEQLADPEFGLQSWTKVALLGGLFIYPAAWGAILSSAIGSVLSGPRVLQSLSLDGLAPKFLSRLSRNGQPAVATWVTGGIALAAVALGNLNTVAKFVTILFLTLYVVVNLVAAIEKLVSEPSYRPKINIPWQLSMLGALGALFVMYLISPIGLVAALGLEFAFYIYFRKKALQQQWGDVHAGFWMRIARFSLLRINERAVGPRNWRPMILVFVQDIRDRLELVKLAAAFGQNKGVLTICKLLLKDQQHALKNRISIKRQMLHDLKNQELEAFCELNVVKSIPAGILNVSKGHGIAGLKTNTVMFGWSLKEGGNANQLKIIRELAISGKNIMLVKFNDPEAWQTNKFESIDLWWGGRESNGDLMLILAYMLKLNRQWEKARIRILAIADNDENGNNLKTAILNSLHQARIVAEVHVATNEGRSFTGILESKSKGTDIVFLGLKHTKEGEENEHALKLEKMASVASKITVFVQNNSLRETMPILLRMPED